MKKHLNRWRCVIVHVECAGKEKEGKKSENEQEKFYNLTKGKNRNGSTRNRNVNQIYQIKHLSLIKWKPGKHHLVPSSPFFSILDIFAIFLFSILSHFISCTLKNVHSVCLFVDLSVQCSVS